MKEVVFWWVYDKKESRAFTQDSKPRRDFYAEETVVRKRGNLVDSSVHRIRILRKDGTEVEKFDYGVGSGYNWKCMRDKITEKLRDLAEKK